MDYRLWTEWVGKIPTPRSPIPDPRSPIPDPRSPIPNPQSPIPNPHMPFLLLVLTLLFSIALFQIFAGIPLSLIGWLHVPNWLFWGAIVLLVTWSIGE